MDPLFDLQDQTLLEMQFSFNLLQRYQTNLRFFELRSSESYITSHIKNSIHVPVESSEITQDLIEKITKEKELSRLRRYCLIVAYSQDFALQVEEFIKMLESIKCREIHRIRNIDAFLVTYFFLGSNFRNISVKDYPNEIVPRFLYLGSQEHAHNRDVIETLNVTHICNVTRNAANLFPEIHYCRVYVDDNETEKISLFFEKAYEFIENALDTCNQEKKNVILVHCAKGVSRSSTIVIMFLMRSCNLSLDESLSFVKKHREIIEPNEGFINELRNFELNSRKFLRRSSELPVSHRNPS